jgi:hypothetical protein
LQHLHEGNFGKAYRHYTQYILLARICAISGLDINKPSQSTTIFTTPPLGLKHSDVFDWAHVAWGNMANYKKKILQAERARVDLASRPSISPAHQTLLQHLRTLAGDVGTPQHFVEMLADRRPKALAWTLSELDTWTKSWA